MNPIIISDDEFKELASNKKVETNTIVFHGDPEIALGSKIRVMNESRTNETDAVITGHKPTESLPKDEHSAYRIELTKED